MTLLRAQLEGDTPWLNELGSLSLGLIADVQPEGIGVGVITLRTLCWEGNVVGWEFVQTTGANQAVVSAGPGGRKAYTFDGTDDYYATTSLDFGGNMLVTDTENWTVVALARVHSAGSYVDPDNHECLITSDATPNWLPIAFRNSSTQFLMVTTLGTTTGTRYDRSGALDYNTWYTFGCRMDNSGNLYQSVDGGTETSHTSATCAVTATPLWVGQSPNGSNFFDGDLAALLVYRSTLTAAQMSDAQLRLREWARL
jgi:hypothetical protein